MKKTAFFIARLLCLLPLVAHAADSSSIATRPYTIDTICVYMVHSESIAMVKGSPTYMIDDQPVSAEQWDRVAIGIQQLNNCKPCVVKTFDLNGRLLSVGRQYKRCNIGPFESYYTSGRLREKGFYLEYSPGKPGAKDPCTGLKDGAWTSFAEDGHILSIQNWTAGKLLGSW